MFPCFFHLAAIFSGEQEGLVGSFGPVSLRSIDQIVLHLDFQYFWNKQDVSKEAEFSQTATVSVNRPLCIKIHEFTLVCPPPSQQHKTHSTSFHFSVLIKNILMAKYLPIYLLSVESVMLIILVMEYGGINGYSMRCHFFSRSKNRQQ
jgi:hypothetical protein